MPFEHSDLHAALPVPNPDRGVGATTDHLTAVRRQSERHHHPGVPLQSAPLGTVSVGPHPDDAIGPTTDHVLAVPGDYEGPDSAGVTRERRQLLTGLAVPDANGAIVVRAADHFASVRGDDE